MKKIFISALSAIAISVFLIISCKVKNNDNLTPTYKNQSTGTGANPNINVVTVTGQQTPGNPATENSSLPVGNSGWQYESCLSNPNKLIAHNGNTTIELRFFGSVTSGTFSLVANAPSSGQVQMIIYGAPGQPGEVVWYSKSGTVVVTPISSGYSAVFSNIPCLQQNYLFPTVTVSGNVIC